MGIVSFKIVSTQRGTTTVHCPRRPSTLSVMSKRNPRRKETPASFASSLQPTKATPFVIWEFPDVLLYHIASFVVPETERAKVLCTKIATLSKSSYRAILGEEENSLTLWELVLAKDYGIVASTFATNANNKSATAITRRSCKRLKRCPIDQVKDAHKLLKDNTEIAYFYLWELSSSTTKSNSLTKSKLCGILNEYGPKLMINKTMSSGGTFLVEVCRSRHATQTCILSCVQELIERRGGIPNLKTNESTNSRLTPLCVAAVRGMPKVVQYLLSKGASTDIQNSARFRLQSNSRKSIRCTNATALEFVKSMLQEERSEGTSQQDLKDLLKVVKLLEARPVQKKEQTTTKAR